MDAANPTSEASIPSPVPPVPRRVAVPLFIGLFLAVLMFGLDGLIVTTALPTIAASLGQSRGVAFVVSAYLISVAISAPVFGRLSDLTSRKRTFLAGLVVFLAGSALAGLSQNLSELVIFRGVQGFGAGAFFPVALAIVTEMFPPTQGARITGALAGASGVAVVVGPLLGAYLLDATSTWRWVFYVNLPVGLSSLAILTVILGPMRPTTLGRFDGIGAGLIAGWVAALIVPLIEISGGGWTWADPQSLALLVASALLLAVFVRWEIRAAEPLVPIRQLTRRMMASLGGLVLLNSVILVGATTLVSIFVGFVVLHEGPNATNDVRDILYWVAVPTTLGALLAGQLLTRFSYRAVIAPALVVSATGGLILLRVSDSTPLWTLQWGFLLVGGLALPLVMLGFGTGMVSAAGLIVVQCESPRSEIGASIALFSFLRNVGSAVGLSVLAAFQQWWFNHLRSSSSSPSGVQAALVSSYQCVFAVIFGLVATSIILALQVSGRIPRVLTPAGGGSASRSTERERRTDQ